LQDKLSLFIFLVVFDREKKLYFLEVLLLIFDIIDLSKIISKMG